MWWGIQSFLHTVHHIAMVDEIVGLLVDPDKVQMAVLVTHLNCCRTDRVVVVHIPKLVVRTPDLYHRHSVNHQMMNVQQRPHRMMLIDRRAVALLVRMAYRLVQAKESTVGYGCRSTL